MARQLIRKFVGASKKFGVKFFGGSTFFGGQQILGVENLWGSKFSKGQEKFPLGSMGG